MLPINICFDCLMFIKNYKYFYVRSDRKLTFYKKKKKFFLNCLCCTYSLDDTV